MSKGKINKEEFFVAEKEGYTAHGNSVKSAISDLKFKIVSEKLKNQPINHDTDFTIEKYRMITGACDAGCRSFMKHNDIPFRVNEDGYTEELKPIKAKDLLPILERCNAYGFEKIKGLITFEY